MQSSFGLKSLPRPCVSSYRLTTPSKKDANFYRVLSLESQNVGLDEIKKAYRSMVLRYHPDVCPPAAKKESTERFLQLQVAYETLSDPISRQMYDSQLALGDPKRRGSAVRDELKFPKEVWEEQLHGLQRRSRDRIRRRRMMKSK